ncbi:histidine phosphatase family protein [Serinibacter arcticus]|uniref:Histidine phosphatase family protein n=2 Tax=Serinibacter arcticus TaxID=1655435 RepID=A0A2U1ZVS4_9MICO|nr:histidine phosphatase family protein [Serinibacter arcticus]
MTLLLIRHGQIEANTRHELETRIPGPELTALGEEQAAALPSLLADVPIVAIHASVMQRTQLTAAPLAEDRSLDVVVTPGLEEIDAGDLTMRSDDVSVDTYLSTALGWAAGELDRAMPGGPNGHAFFERYDAAVEAVVAAASDAGGADGGGSGVAVAFSHGAAIRTWVAGRAVNAAGSDALARALGNTGVVELELVDGEWHLVAWEGTPWTELVAPDREADPTEPDRPAR